MRKGTVILMICLIKSLNVAERSMKKLGIKEQMDTITNRYNKWLYLFHISSC